MSQQHSTNVHLSSGGNISISIWVDIFNLSKQERQWLFELIDILQEYKAKHETVGGSR